MKSLAEANFLLTSIVSKIPKEQIRSAMAATQAIYADLASRPVERNCTGIAQCCHFRLTGKTPHLTRGEALTAWAAVKASGRKVLPESIDGACPLLNPKTQRCLIYAGRPFGCRTHFCGAAGGPMARDSVIDLIHRLETIDAAAGGDGPKPFASALREAEDL